MTTITQPFQYDLQPQVQETHRTTHAGPTTRCRTQRRNRLISKRSKPHPPHTGGTFHRRLQPLYTEKCKVSCSGFLPKTKPMQHSCSHYNAFCSMTWRIRMHLRTWHHQMTAMTQPFQCELQPQIQETHRSTHTGTTTRCRTQRRRRRNRLTSKRTKPHPPHTGGTFHRRLQPLYTEKCKVSCSGFLPKTKPMQHSCSHYNAFCSMTWLIRMHLRTWHHQMTTMTQPFQCDVQPQVQETHRTTHTGTTTRCRTQRRRRRNRLTSKRTKPHPPHTGGTFHRWLQPPYTEKHKVRAPASSPTQAPCKVHAGQFFCDVLLFSVKPHTAPHQGQFFCDVLLCDVKSRAALNQGQVFCDELLCVVRSHTALHQRQFFCDALLCDVKSHTVFHQGQCFCDVLLCDVKSHIALHQGQFFCDVLFSSVKSHTALHQGQFFCDVLLCSVKSHTVFH